MIDPEVYLSDALDSQRQRNSFKVARQTPNFLKLSTERLVVPITLHLPITPTFVIRDHFDWDLAEGYRSVELFAEKLTAAVGLKDKEEVSNQIYEQIVEHVEKYTVQQRTRTIRKPEDHTSNNVTCLNCDSILYSHDICRACGVSLEKLRQKYGQLNIVLPESRPEEEEPVTVRQTERQKNLESMRRKLDSAAGASGKKMCSRCGEPNHVLSWECRQCGKQLAKA